MLVFYSSKNIQRRNILTALYTQFNCIHTKLQCIAIEFSSSRSLYVLNCVVGETLLFSRRCFCFFASSFQLTIICEYNVYLCASVLKNVCLFCFCCSLNPVYIWMCKNSESGLLFVSFFRLLLFFFLVPWQIFSHQEKRIAFQVGYMYKSVTSCSQHDI